MFNLDLASMLVCSLSILVLTNCKLRKKGGVQRCTTTVCCVCAQFALVFLGCEKKKLFVRVMNATFVP